MKYLNKNQEGSFKAIVFSCFITTCKYLETQLKEDYAVCMMTGKTTVKEMELQKRRFEQAQTPTILICSDVMKEGHNLQFCQYLIHYDFPFTPAALNQRNGRIYRKGQENPPQAFYLPLKVGYDQRLFGEIIVEKCQIIEEIAEEGGC